MSFLVDSSPPREGESGKIAPRPLWRGQSGNTILQVIVLLFVLIMGVYFLSDKLISQKNVVLQTSSMLRVRFALHSIVDYMYFNIQRRSCMDENLLANTGSCQLGTKAGGTLANSTSELLTGDHVLAPNAKGGSARSLERVLLSYNLAHNMESMIDLNCVDLMLERNFAPPTGACTPVIGTMNHGNLVYNESLITQVDTMEIVTAARNIGPGHPLYAVIEPVYRALNDELAVKTSTAGGTTVTKQDFFIRVNVHRDTEGNPPVSGSETYFLVTVQFEDVNHKQLIANRIPLRLQSYGTIFPREVGSFALMVPRDLRLDNGAVAAPDIAIPAVANWPSSNPGLIFQSPVFVNGDLHLPTPASGSHFTGQGNYSPVTFGDRVVLGSGLIYDGDALYQPNSAGGKNDAYWSENHMLGGLKMGALIDNAWDKGLMMYGEFNVGFFPNQLFNQCRQWIASQSIRDSAVQLYAGLQPGQPANTFDWILGLVNPANVATDTTSPSYYPYPATLFNPQIAALSAVVNSGMWSAIRTLTNPPASATASGNAIVNVSFSLGARTASADLPLNSSLTITAPVGDQTDASTSTAIIGGDFSSSPQLQALKTLSTSTDTAVAAAATAQIASLVAAYQNPGTVKIELNGVHYETDKIDNPASASFPQNEKHLAELKVTYTNPQSFLDGSATPTLLVPGLQVAALGFQQSITQTASSSVSRKILFTNDPAAGVALPTPYWMVASGATAAPASPYDSFHVNDQYGFHSAVNYDGQDYLNFDLQCSQASGKATGQSFGAAAWNVDFSPDGAHVRTSWNAANDTTSNYSDSNNWSGTYVNGATQGVSTPSVGEIYCPSGANSCQAGDDCTRKFAMCDVQFDGGNSAMAGVRNNPNPLPVDAADGIHNSKRDDFRAFTIVQDCHIENTADLVAGFFTCDTLEIKGGRTTPLYIIGTFIVRNLIFDDEVNAMKNGIRWMSIYHPDAVGILRASRILRRLSSSVPCDDNTFTGLPIWDVSGMSLSKQADMRSCNVISLRAKSDNFRWTSVDPDCGPPPTGTGSGSVCKRHPVNYLVMEHGRGGGP